jgi:catechol 2,3-dioxygenase-like lactoylglutathione lyase family enzyme
MLRKIDRVVLRVPGVAGAAQFYRDVLGLELIRQDPHVAGFRLPDGGELILHDDPDQPFEQVYFLVQDVRDLYRRREEFKLTFIQPPRLAARGYRAAIKDPFGTVLLIVDRGAAGQERMEDAAAADGLFPGTEPQATIKPELLARLYEEVGRTADDLPYTPQFEKLHLGYAAAHAQARPTRRQTWRHLLTLRKGGNLPKLGQTATPPPKASDEAIARLEQLIGTGMGRRDRLPYTEEFDRLVDAFNASCDRPLSPHLVWRLVARLAK